MQTQSLESTYKNQKFRSRLEARFAIFFDALGCEWQYEPEGFRLPSGNYLPDFYLPKVEGGAWIEVKPYGRNQFFGFVGSGPRKNDKRLEEFSSLAASSKTLFFVAHGIPSESYFKNFGYESEGMLETPYDPFRWCFCGCSKTLGIQFDGRGDRVDCDNPYCTKSSHGDKGYSYDHKKIVEAALIARTVRFDNGRAFV